MGRQAVAQPVSLMCVAASTDAALLVQWETHLRLLEQGGTVTVWSGRHMQAGANHKEELFRHLEQAACLVLLLSADFFLCDECLALMERGLERHREGDLALIPLLVRPVAWQTSPLATFACLPANGTPIITWEYPDAGWLNAVQGMQRLLGRLALPSASVIPLGKRAATDRERMLRLLRRTYQTALSESLQGMTWMELGLADHPDATWNATHLLQRLPDRTERHLPTGTSILSAYDQAEEELLILGAPGAGKSTLLLDLALHLIARAESDETHPLPIIVPLSSWAVARGRIEDWLVEQLAHIYDVPRKLGQQWVMQGRVLSLLDGLDEMEEAARPSCIAAINAYRGEQMIPLVVCSRKAEYDVASARERLVLQNAVVVQPLTDEQVADLIHQASSELAGLQEAFLEQSTLRELATTPLMLGVMILAYRGMTIDPLRLRQGPLEARVWTDYVERMVRTKGAEYQRRRTKRPVKRYSLAQTTSTLSWLARQMRNQNQTVFYGEYLSANWLLASQRRAGTWLLARLPAILLGIATSLLLSIFVLRTNDPGILCVSGVPGGFLGWWFSQGQRGSKADTSSAPSRWKQVLQGSLPHLLRAIAFGVLTAASFGFSNRFGGLLDLYTFGICLSVSSWVLETQLTHINSSPNPPQSRHRRSRVFGWMRTFSGRRAMWTTMLLGIGFGLSYGLIYGLRYGLSYGLSDGLSIGLYDGLILGGTAFLVSSLLETGTGGIHLVERIQWTGRPLFQRHHLRTSLLVSVTVGCPFGLIYGLSTGLSVALSTGQIYGLNYGLSHGLSNGLGDVFSYGLIGGLSVGFIYWVLAGLYQGITQRHLEDSDRRRFNQGLHRSLRNGLLLSLLSAGIITGLTIGLHSLDIEWLIALCGWLVVWAATGGLALLRHSLVRLLLAQSRTFPWRAQRFLDDATARVLLRRVGGGYRFVHRRLLDYFADSSLSVKREENAKIQE